MITGARAELASALPQLQELAGRSGGGDTPLPAGAARTAWDLVSGVLAPLAPDVPHNATQGAASALVSGLRQQGLCTLDEAHALLDLHAMASRESPDGSSAASVSTSVATSAGGLPRQVFERATSALQRIVATASADATTAPLGAEYARAAGAGARAQTAATKPLPSAAFTPSGSVPDASGGRSSAFVVGLVVVCLIAAGAAAVLFSGVGRTSALDRGVAAYEAGQRVVARIAFEEAMAKQPDDPMPLVYLGRLSREEGDLPQARKLLEQAVARAPENALTHRELAAALLADNDPELARRFYVRALTITPDDRLAQGFLGCALARLGRDDEAARWLERAGPGDWTVCANTP